jgi:hypothetical protein
MLTGFDAGAALLMHAGLAPSERPMAVPAGELPEVPGSWHVVRDSHGGDATERFIGYVTGHGLIVTMHSVSGIPDGPGGRLIALVTLGRHRVSFVETPLARFEARWCVGSRHHCLAAATTLARFMPLALALSWP